MLSNLADVLRESAESSPASVAVIDGDRRTTYAGLDDRVSNLARALLSRGLEPGDRVALLLGNHQEFVVALYGVMRAGGVAVPLNTSSVAAELDHALGSVSPRLLIHESVHTRTVVETDSSCATVVTGTRKWDEMIHYREQGDLPRADPESTALLLFTSGTSGRPRAAMLSHRALLDNVQQLLELDPDRSITSDDVSLAVLPLSHAYSLNTVLTTALAAGATVVLSERFDPAGTLNLIREHRVTVVGGAPPMYVAWSGEQGLREAFAHTRLALSGAAPLAPALFAQFRTMTGKPIYEGYGLTECSPIVTSSLVSGRPKAGSVGCPLPGVDVKIVPESMQGPGVTIDGMDDTLGEPGEVWIRGRSVFSGYWPDGADGPDEQGWFGTGDVGYLDTEGDLTLVDKRSDLILVSGFNVYPREVERVAEQHPAVLECAVIGVPHPYSGEAVKAVVSLQEGAQLGADELVAHCEGQLARFRCPTIIEIVQRLPHGPTGKLDKSQLRHP